MTPTPSPSFLLGLDIGGTFARALAQDPARAGSEPVALSDEPGGNLQQVGADQLAELLSRYTEDARSALGVQGAGVVCAGIAGAGRQADRTELVLAFKDRCPDCSLLVFPDTTVALEGAFPGRSGMIVITGTGSGASLRDISGRYLSAGGWGATLGDPGSAWNLGMDALRALALRMDRDGPDDVHTLRNSAEDAMLASLQEDHDLGRREDVIAFVRSAASRAVSGRSPAQLARSVLRAAANGDSTAIAIIDRNIQHLVRQVCALVGRAAETNKHYAHLGGLATGDWYSKKLQQELGKMLPGWRCVEPEGNPQLGALQLARQHAGRQ